MIEKAKQSLNDLNLILEKTNKYWFCGSKQAIKYRRRKIPSYLLHHDSPKYPMYLCQSKLSLAFANVNNIKLKVDLDYY